LSAANETYLLMFTFVYTSFKYALNNTLQLRVDLSTFGRFLYSSSNVSVDGLG